jgi:hypothetical protein
MYLCVCIYNFLLITMILIFDFGNVPVLWYSLLFILILNFITDINSLHKNTFLQADISSKTVLTTYWEVINDAKS